MTLFNCYQLFHSNTIYWESFTQMSLVFQAKPIYWQTSIRYNYNRSHGIFLTPPNTLFQLNNVVLESLNFKNEKKTNLLSLLVPM